MGLFLTNSAIFISMSIGIIIVVLLALLGSLTLIPALLGILGDNINRLRLPIIGRETQGPDTGGIWGAITDKVLARPGILATVTTAALIAVAVPVVSLDIGFPGGSKSYHDAVEGKRALQLLEEHFTGGLTQPAFVVVDAPDVNSAGDLLYVQVPIDDDEPEDAIRHLREDIFPVAFAKDTTAQVSVTGEGAGSLDFAEQMKRTAPYVFGFVLGLAFLLLLVMFRSIVIPFKAIALNLLSVGAAYGVLVAVFQFGWGISLLGMETTGVVMSWLPVFLFSILFGLSMDSHMLVLNRIKEFYDQGLSNEESVSQGIKVTAGQITSAAAIMVGVFGAFALGRQIELKQMGLGLAVAVLVDATIIRSILLPASMKLLGDRNWYLPSWLEWLPTLGPEASQPLTPEPALQPRYGVTSGQTVPDASGDGGD